MDSTGSRASHESIEGFSSGEDGDCDVFLSDSDSERHAKGSGSCPARPTGLPPRDQPPLTLPQAFIPHPMSASHLKNPLENIYFASASESRGGTSAGGADVGQDWMLPGSGQLYKRFVSRGLKRRWEWDETRQHWEATGERVAHVKTRGDLLFAQKCQELQVFIRPLTALLDGLKSGRYSRGLSGVQQSVAMDRIQRIVGVLQKPAMGERYLGTLLQVEMMLKVWFPHVAVETAHGVGSGPTETECSARKHGQTNSSGTSSSWESVSPSSSRSQSFSDGGAQELLNMVAAGGQKERPEPGGGAPAGPNGGGLAWLRGPGHPRARQTDDAASARCFALVMQDGSVTSTSTTCRCPAGAANAGPPARPGRSRSAPPCLPAPRGGQPPGTADPWPAFLTCDSILLVDLREKPGVHGREAK